jgi:3-phosphoshikimate 1-carboxyvinyltransferase
MKTYNISKNDGILKGRIRLPASKSISNRLLMIKTLCADKFELCNLSVAEDTVLLQRLLEMIARSKGKPQVIELNTENAGTVFRFLTAYLSTKEGSWMLTGSYRMKQRPVGILVEALKSLGASVDYLAKPGFPPLLIKGRQLTGGEVFIDPSVSSQFASALLLIAPCLPAGLTINLKGKPVSSPYMTMTIQLMQSFGAKITQGKSRVKVSHGKYSPSGINVESDWSAAAFWYEAAALSSDVDLFLEGLVENSLQGDSILPEIFENFGVHSEFTEEGVRLTRFQKKIDGFYYNFSDQPDLAQAVISTCAGLGIRGRFEGLNSLLIKETNRLRAMKLELEKLGIIVRSPDQMSGMPVLDLEPGRHTPVAGITFETYGDHRMAMALAPLALKIKSLRIRNPEVVIKSYPDFWNHLENSGFLITQA